MEALKRALIAMTLGGLLLVQAGQVGAFDGRYVGSYHHQPGLLEDNRMQHLLDLGTRSTLYGGTDLRLWLNLSYTSRPGTAESELLQGRAAVELRKSVWRFHGQVEPWQDTTPGVGSSRKRRLNFNLDITPRNAPHIRVDWIRTDREAPLVGRSDIEDRRIRVEYAFEGGGTGIGYRRLDSGSLRAESDRRHTDEWQADIRKNWSWRTVRLLTAYEGQINQMRFRERRIDYNVNRFTLNGNWSPHRKVRVGGNAVAREGRNRDNAVASAGRIEERFLSARASYLPVQGLDLSVIREYRRRQGRGAADYWQAQAQLRRELVRRVNFHGGFTRTQDLAGLTGSAPKSSGFLIMDGRIRRGLSARAEVRAAWENDIQFLDTQWHRLAQIRMNRGSTYRLEATWRRIDDSRLEGAGQVDDSWDLFLGYRPATTLDLAVTYRTLDGSGRISRSERYRSLSSTWEVSPFLSFSGDWSRRRTHTNGSSRKETVSGAEARLSFPRRWMARITFRHQSGSIRTGTDTYGLILEKRF